jgi:hypothetical protein
LSRSTTVCDQSFDSAAILIADALMQRSAEKNRLAQGRRN